jgi:hypothetical protein
MGGRNHVPPPDAALAPNTAPGRLFWDKVHADDDEDAYQAVPAKPIVTDPGAPNLTRQNLADVLFSQNIMAGQDPETARANADARALQMVP